MTSPPDGLDQPEGRDRISDPALRAALLRRRDADQSARRNQDPAILPELVALTDANTAWLKSLVGSIGWPGHARVGEDGSHAAWLLVQHADGDLPLQRHCLALLQAAVAAGDASPIDLAHLSDRVRLADGRQQLYGTQFIGYDGRYEAPRLHDRQQVDARRAALGMGPLADHLARVLDLYGPPVPARLLCPRCGAAVAVWLPELGGSRVFRCSGCGFETRLRARIAPI